MAVFNTSRLFMGASFVLPRQARYGFVTSGTALTASG
jgi:hypothetical protein